MTTFLAHFIAGPLDGEWRDIPQPLPETWRHFDRRHTSTYVLCVATDGDLIGRYVYVESNLAENLDSHRYEPLFDDAS